MLISYPRSVNVINKKKTNTRFIFKIGYGVESIEDWKEEEKQPNMEGSLFVNKNKYIYKFTVE